MFTLRLKNATLSYSIPSADQSKLRTKVFMSGQNLFVFSSNKDTNPEFMLAGFSSPLLVISFGLSLTY
jgi:hypothetical protein